MLNSLRDQIDTGQWTNAMNQIQELEERELTENQQWELDLLRAFVMIELNEIKTAEPIVSNLEDSFDKEPAKAKKLGFLSIKARLAFQKGKINQSQSLINEFLDQIEQLDKTFLDNYRYLEADLLNLQGLIKLGKNNFKEAIQDFEQSKLINKKLNRIRQEAMNLYNIGRVHLLQNQSKAAIPFLEESLDSFKTIDDIEGKAACFDKLQNAYNAIGENDNAFRYKQDRRELKNQLEFEEYKRQTIKEKTLLQDRINELTSQQEKLEQKVLSLKSELENVEAVYEGKNKISEPVGEGKFEDLKDQKREIEKKYQSATDNLQDKEKQIEALEKDRARLNEQISELNSKIKDKSREVNELKSSIDDLESKNNDLEEELEGLHEEKESIEEEFEITLQKKDELKNKLDQLKKDHETKLSELEEKEAIIKDQNKKYEELQTDIDEFEEENSQLKEEVKQFQKQVDTINKEKKKLEEKVEGLKSSSNVLKSEKNELQKEVTDLKKENKEYLSEISGLRSTVSSQESQINKLESKINELETKQEQLQPKDLTDKEQREQLEEFLASSKLAEQIYDWLQKDKEMELKFLATRVGVSPERCRTTVDKLAEIGVIELENGSSKSPNIRFSS